MQGNKLGHPRDSNSIQKRREWAIEQVVQIALEGFMPTQGNKREATRRWGILAGVIRATIPSQKVLPTDPARKSEVIETKKRRIPMITFGWAKKNYTWKQEAQRKLKIKGRKIVVQEKRPIKKSLILTNINPCLANEIITNPAREKKKI